MEKTSMQQPQIERVEFDQQQIKKKSGQLKQKLFLGHQKSQLKYKNGIVFIGNSRVGKSTLAMILACMQMRKKLNGNVVVIQPVQEKYRKQTNLIQHTFTSVTSYPNVKEIQIDGQYYTIVDLPGFMDTSYEKQLCNWAYIKNILQQLQKILFVMVLHVHSQDLTIKDDELSMMNRFKQAFPTGEKFKPKENLCMIVNFVQGIETQQKEILMKERIIKEMQKQLNGDMELNGFYMRSLDKSRLLVVERARGDDIVNNNKPYTIPKLLPFIKSNLNKLQPPQPSQHKLNLTLSNNPKSQQLRQIIKHLMQSTLQQISQRINEYKYFLSQVLSMMSQTAGVQLVKQNFVRLENYQFKKKLTKYKKIQLPKQYSTININNLSQSQQSQQQLLLNEQPLQHVIFTIVQLLNQINNTKHFEQTKFGFINLLQQVMLFYKCIQKVATRLMTNQQLRRQFLSITDNFKKSVYIDCLDMVGLNDNVKDFLVPIVELNDQVSFYQLMKDALFDTYDSITRISTFKQSLKRYINNLLKLYYEKSHQNVELNKINIQTLKKLSTTCQLTNLKQLQLKTSTLRFIVSHKRIRNVNFVKNLDVLYDVLGCIQNNTKNGDNNNGQQENYTKQEMQQIQKWKQQQCDQWNCIKGKNYLFMLNDILSKTGYENKKQLLTFYLNGGNISTQCEQIINLLKKLIQVDVQQKKCDRLTAFQLCMQAKQKMVAEWEINGAMACCKLTQKLYLYEDKKRFLQARREYLALVKRLALLSVQQQQEMNEYQNKLAQTSWTIISDQLYDKLIQTVKQHCVTITTTIQQQRIRSSQSLTLPQHHNSTTSRKNSNNFTNSTTVNMNKMFSSPVTGQAKQSKQILLINNRQQVTRFVENAQKQGVVNNNNNNQTKANGVINGQEKERGSEKKVESNNSCNNSEGGQSPPQPQKKLRGFKTFK